jgi:hypothetical protein
MSDGCGSRAALVAAAIGCTLLVAACGGGGGSAPAPPTPEPLPDPQFRVSSLSPFAAGCEGGLASGTLYLNSEVEPLVAANPADGANLIGVWQQDRWSNGGARGNLSAASFDGGRTWSPSMAAFSRCAGGTPSNGGDYERASDPWVSIGPDGVAYQVAVAFTGLMSAPGSSNAVLVSRSTDGGRSWSGPLALIRDGADNFNDKESVTADPGLAGYAYAVWDRLAANGHGPTYLSRTTDGGASWEAPRMIYDPGPASQTINNQAVVTTDGTVVVLFTRLDPAAGGMATATLVVIRSADRGISWSAPIVVSPVQSVGARDPETGAAVRDGSNLGSIAAGPGNMLAVAWQDARFTGGARDAVALSRSTDGGLTWTTPIRVSRDPSVPAFEPAVSVRSDGTIGVTYFDFRSNTSLPATLPTDTWIARSIDGATWLESRLAAPFDLALAPDAGGRFLGDYQGLVAIGGDFVPFYAAVNDGDVGNRTDIFASIVTSAGLAAQAEAALPPLRSPAAQPLPVGPELARRMSASIARTMQRRVPARVAPWIDASVLAEP